MADWYFDDAMRMLEKAQKKKGVARRRQTLAAMRQLIAYLAGRSSPPRRNAINDEDEAVCDKCFCKIRSRGLSKEMCLKCEGKTSSKRKGDANEEDNEERIASLTGHGNRIKAELERLGFDKDKPDKPKRSTTARTLTRGELQRRLMESTDADDILVTQSGGHSTG